MKFLQASIFHCLLVVSFMAVFAVHEAARAENGTVPYIDGVPLPNGFYVSEDDVLLFDKPAGRVIEVTAWCADACLTTNDLTAFYARSLPPLGWVRGADNGYVRDGMHLKIDVIKPGNGAETLLIFRSGD